MTRLRMVEMWMVRMMYGKTLKDNWKSQELRARVGVDDIEGFLRGHRLWWAGHVERAGEGVLKQVREMKVEGTRKKGRLKLTWEELLGKDMREVGLNREMAEDQAEWKRWCQQMVDPCVPG